MKTSFHQRSVDLICDDKRKNWWRTVKIIYGLNSKDTTLEYDGDIIKLAQKIINTFVSVSQDLDPLEPLSYAQYDNLPDELIITVDSVEKQLLHTKLHKAIGPDQMPDWILKDAAAIIAAPICHLFNSSLRDCYIHTL